jgi:predicted cupin superfamily sugar epimerase
MPELNNAEYWIKRLDLRAHPEGGYFIESYRSGELISQSALPDRYSGPRSFSTSIYFLLQEGVFSAFHRIKSDEGWYFHTGDPLEIFIIFPDGTLQRTVLGMDKDASLQFSVPHGTWFASRTSGAFSLVGCSVSPGFDFADFEMGGFKELSERYPQHTDLIRELTRS